MPLQTKPYHRLSKAEITRLFRESNTWSADRLQEMQWRKLQFLLKHAYENSPFHQERFQKLGLHPERDFHSFECLSKLPVLNKADIQQAGEKIRAYGNLVQEPECNSTGGSTGNPLNFYQDANYRRWADVARDRAWRWYPGIHPWSVEAVLWGAIRDVGKGISLLSMAKHVLRYRMLQLNTFDLDESTVRKYFKIYNWVRPDLMRGYASSLYFLANFIDSKGLKIHKPKLILSSADVLWPAMRKRITEVFEADIVDSYGCREVSQLGTECLKHQGLHIVMENQYVELVDKKIVVTNLNNLAMPFLRYEIGDMAQRIETAPCPCGRGAYRLMELMGRDNDNISLPNGKIISDIFFEFLFFGFKTVEQFQVVYGKQEQQLLVRVKVTDRSEGIDAMIVKRMEESFHFSNVRVEFVDGFPAAPTGKFRFVYTVDSLLQEAPRDR